MDTGLASIGAHAPRRRRRRTRLLAAVAVALAATLIATVSSLALFTDSTPVGANAISADPCFQARVASVQTGQLTSNVNGVQSATITSVDPARSFLLFSVRSNLNRPPGSTVRGRLADATTVEFARVTDEGTPAAIEIEWSVVEYACGVSVQRGSATVSATPTDVTITAVDTSRAFVTASKTTLATDTTFSLDDPVAAYLTSGTNLRLTQGDGTSGHEVWWQVVEYERSTDAFVQRGSVSLTGGALSTTDTLATAVDPSRAFVLATYETTGDGADVGARLITATLTNATTVTFDRDVAGDADDITDIRYEVVELSDGTVVQHGSTDLAAGTGSVDVTIGPVATAVSTVTSTVSGFAGQSTGRTSHVADDVVGEASATLRLVDATTVRVERSATSSAATLAWNVVTWGGPPWWDTSYGFRRPMTVATGDGGSTTTIDQRVSTGNDDGEEAAGGAMDLTSTDLELIQEGTQQIVGIRYPSIGIPQGAEITAAWIQFTVDEVSTGAITVNLRAEDIDSAPAITTTSGDLSARTRTTATVAWSPPDWPTADVEGPDQRTPDLSAVVQEVVDRPGWTTSSALLFIIDGTDSTRRTAESYNGSAAQAPQLHVEYTVGGQAEVDYPTTFTIDHGALAGGSFSESSGDDVRVTYWNGTGWVEIDRVVDSDSAWLQSDTALWFPLAATMPKLSTHPSYWIYYRNPAAGAPPTDASERIDPAPTVALSDTQTRDASCGAIPAVASVQSGQTTSTGNGTITVNVSSVDTTKAFLLFSTRSSSNRPPGTTLKGRLASATTLEFTRVTDETSSIDISWSLVEYDCGVSVQRGAVVPSAAVTDVTITAVQTGSSFATASKTVAAGDGAFDANDPFTVHLTSSTNLRIEHNSGSGSHEVWWQVVEFTDPVVASVQRGSASLTGGALTTSVDLASAVDPDRAFVLASHLSGGSGADVGARLIRAELTDADTVTFTREIAGDDSIADIRFEVVELHEGSAVQHGSTVLTATTAVVNVGIDAVTQATATAFATVQSYAGQSLGSTAYNADDTVGEGAAALTLLDATTLEVRRSSTNANAEIAWNVIDWSAASGPGTWWDTAFAQRRRVEITTGTDAAPVGAPVAVTLDHAAMVAKGLSRADGDDLRFTYWNGSAWVELDRVLATGSSWNTSATTVWFELGAAIGASSTDTDHWIHLAAPGAGAPPAGFTPPGTSDVTVTATLSAIDDQQ